MQKALLEELNFELDEVEQTRMQGNNDYSAREGLFRNCSILIRQPAINQATKYGQLDDSLIDAAVACNNRSCDNKINMQDAEQDSTSKIIDVDAVLRYGQGGNDLDQSVTTTPTI